MIYFKANLGFGPDLPVWPPTPGLLAPDWMHAPRSEWSLENWRDYATDLELLGHDLVTEIENARKEIDRFREKLSRKPEGQGRDEIAAGLFESLLASGPRQRGRPKGSGRNRTRAALALTIQADSASLGRPISKIAAAVQLLRREGDRNPDPKAVRALTNEMSKQAPKKKAQKSAGVTLDIWRHPLRD
ncbi:hypothetical protein [Variovorax sp. SRS16]|uniref:hypothetical protein n=1 Tax=Variovorax sp. SRS16 TaxID=282217 RepID=UPI001E3D08FA|nr:hypothetical protein [Variovorax sp. SRS16]